MNAVRKAIEGLYDGVCTVYVREASPGHDPVSGETVFVENAVISDAPCRLSYSRITETSPGVAARVTQTVKLFIAPEAEVPPGSKITVTQNGVTGHYAQSGEAAVYASHREIPLALFERYA
ncbi:MAG: hypothetical protein LBR72_02855 [Oscillospiraceae bacterium]|nr:hypothetical protein [Oscillospiraceae bacterium]